MLVSILHRLTGALVSLFGGALFVWWLLALAGGPQAYERFVAQQHRWYLIVVWVLVSWGLMQHTLSGVRHLVMDIGAGFELSANRFWAVMTLAGSVLLTALLWYYIGVVR